MSLGMMMMPPPMVSLPLKLLLIVMVDGWSLVTSTLISGFNIRGLRVMTDQIVVECHPGITDRRQNFSPHFASTALFVGVFMGLIQSVTQIQEQTLSFVPKFIAVGAVIALEDHG